MKAKFMYITYNVLHNICINIYFTIDNVDKYKTLG